jgi:hypothetical protein
MTLTNRCFDSSVLLASVQAIKPSGRPTPPRGPSSQQQKFWKRPVQFIVALFRLFSFWPFYLAFINGTLTLAFTRAVITICSPFMTPVPIAVRMPLIIDQEVPVVARHLEYEYLLGAAPDHVETQIGPMSGTYIYLFNPLF